MDTTSRRRARWARALPAFMLSLVAACGGGEGLEAGDRRRVEDVVEELAVLGVDGFDERASGIVRGRERWWLGAGRGGWHRHGLVDGGDEVGRGKEAPAAALEGNGEAEDEHGAVVDDEGRVGVVDGFDRVEGVMRDGVAAGDDGFAQRAMPWPTAATASGRIGVVAA